MKIYVGKLTATLLAVAFMLGLTPGGTIPARAACTEEPCSFLVGEGIKDKPYEISSPQDFDHLREHVTSAASFAIVGIPSLSEILELLDLHDSIKTPTVFYKLMKDIDLSEYSGGKGWTPIGDETTAFFGELDGKGFKITGLRINNRTGEYQGLFGTVAGTIKNLTIKKCSVIGGTTTGAITARMTGTMENCHVSGSVFGSGNAGGLVGDLAGTAIKCSNAANVSAIDSTQRIGGIAGRLSTQKIPIPPPFDTLYKISFMGEIKQCFNSGNITNITAANPGVDDGSRVGGIAGAAEESLPIENCFNTGNIRATGRYAGGITGYAWHSKVTNCYSTGKVEGGDNAAGGIAGAARRTDSGVSNSIALNSSVTGIGENINRVCGYLWDSPTMSNNYGRTDMPVNGAPVSGGTLTNANGVNKTVEDINPTSFWKDTVGFNETVWILEKDKLPVLSGVNGEPNELADPEILSVTADTSSSEVKIDIFRPLDSHEILIVSVYKGGKLIEMLAENEISHFGEADITVTSTGMTGADKIKVMWWGTDVYPLCKAAEIENNSGWTEFPKK